MIRIAMLMAMMSLRDSVVLGYSSPTLSRTRTNVIIQPQSRHLPLTFSSSARAAMVDTTRIEASKTPNNNDKSNHDNTWKRVRRNMTRMLSTSTIMMSQVFKTFGQFWWSLPLGLAAFPLYSAITTGSYACMPEWWPVVCLKGIFGSFFWVVVSGFLLSNICYFASGAYLVKRFITSNDHQSNKPFLLLGTWILLAGLISTIYHSVQAIVGVNNVLHTLAFIDHGVALTAGCYYLDTCGWPSKKVLTIGLSGIACLAVCYNAETYAILHALWHGLSAAAATTWAVEGHGRKIIRETVAMEFFGQTDTFLIKRV